MKITETLIKKLAPPTAKPYHIVWDSEIPGFGVRITIAGVKSFILSYWMHERKKRYTIERYPVLSVDAAREKARKLRAGLLDGKDPLLEKYSGEGEPTFGDLADEYLKDAELTKRPGSLRNDRVHLARLRPKWSHRLVKSITRYDILKLTKEYEATPVQANRMLALLSTMFNFAMHPDRAWRTDNPVKGVKRYHEDKRKKYLDVDELTRLNKALDAYHNQSTADAIRLLLFTGARKGEVLQADWKEFDMKRGTWTKPSHHTKNRKTEQVPLSDAALSLLLKMKPRESGPLFPGADGDSRVTLQRPWRQICKAAGLAQAVEIRGKRRMLTRYKPKWRIHDLRHTFASHLVSSGVSLQLVGKLLGHTQPSTTDRYAHATEAALRNAANRANILAVGA